MSLEKHGKYILKQQGDCVANYKILVKYKNGIFDAESEFIKKSILDIGIRKKVSVKITYVYEISGNIGFDKIKIICQNLLVDTLTQQIFINFNPVSNSTAIAVYYKSGVTDAVAETVKIGIQDIGVNNELFVKTGKKYFFENTLSKKELKLIAEKILANTVIQDYRIIDGN